MSMQNIYVKYRKECPTKKKSRIGIPVLSPLSKLVQWPKPPGASKTRSENGELNWELDLAVLKVVGNNKKKSYSPNGSWIMMIYHGKKIKDHLLNKSKGTKLGATWGFVSKILLASFHLMKTLDLSRATSKLSSIFETFSLNLWKFIYFPILNMGAPTICCHKKFTWTQFQGSQNKKNILLHRLATHPLTAKLAFHHRRLGPCQLSMLGFARVSLPNQKKTPRGTNPENERMAGKPTMNEDVFHIENGDFPASHVSFQGCTELWWTHQLNSPRKTSEEKHTLFFFEDISA